MKLIVSLLILSLFLSSVVSFKNKRVAKTGIRIKSDKWLPDERIYPNIPIHEMVPSVIEDNSKAYRRLLPGEDNEGAEVYKKDPAPYYGNEEARVTPEQLANEEGPFQVFDTAALKDTHFDPLQGVLKVRKDPGQNTWPENHYYTEVGPINHKDPAPYYDPIQNPDNMWKKKSPNMFATPVQYKDDLFESDHAAKQAWKRRLKKEPGMYYDPTHRLEREDSDPLADAVQADKDFRAEAPAVQIDEFNKQQKADAGKWGGVLNHPSTPYYGGTAYIKWVKKLTDKWAYGRVTDQNHLIKQNDQRLYYDGSGVGGRRRFFRRRR